MVSVTFCRNFFFREPFSTRVPYAGWRGSNLALFPKSVHVHVAPPFNLHLSIRRCALHNYLPLSHHVFMYYERPFVLCAIVKCLYTVIYVYIHLLLHWCCVARCVCALT